jgi:hypothetical protein
MFRHFATYIYRLKRYPIEAFNNPVVGIKVCSHFVPVMFTVGSSALYYLLLVPNVVLLAVTLLYVGVVPMLARTSSYVIPKACRNGSGRE